MLQQIQIAIYEKLYGNLIADWSAKADSLDWSKNTHGAATLGLFVEMPEDEAYSWYDRTAAYRVELNDGPINVWGGRLEDVRVVDGGIQVTAYGSWRAFGDIEHTALWSTTDLGLFEVATTQQGAAYRDKKWGFDKDNRLVTSLKKNTTYAFTNRGEQYISIPSGSSKKILRIQCDYTLLTSNNFGLRITSYQSPYTYVSDLHSIAGNSLSQTGSLDLTLAIPSDIVAFGLVCANGTTYTYTGEDGDEYVIFNNIRITTSTIPVEADDIVTALVAEVAATNPTQLSASTALIQSPLVDLKDVLFENELPAEIIDQLVSYGDNSTPLQVWHAGVTNDQEVYFQPFGYNARTWYIDITETLEAEVTLDSLVNRVQAVYKDASGNTVRSVSVNDTASQARYGIVRARSVSVNTSDSTAATIQRDLALADGATPAPRTGFDVDAIYDESGAAWPVTYAEIGDTIIVRNFAPVFIQDIDRLTTFRLSEIECHDNGTARLTPEQAIPRLETYLAQQARP